RYKFRLRQIDFDGAFEYSEEIEAVIELAGTHRLGAAYPNPFNPSTTFELIVGREQRVQIDIINALGQRVQRMFDGAMEANEPKNFVFNARMLPTGLYFYRVIGENFAQTRQMLLVK
ncbi:MAG: T9SS type A sorting domain-containing protein, partial [Rhodothermia bacterium]